jgi:glycerol-3-phosphate dehydrogenase
MPRRTRPPRIAIADDHGVADLIREDATYGQIICPCAMVSAGEVRAAIHGPVPAHTLDALKRRLWVMAGPCQGSLCIAALTSLLARERRIDTSHIRKHVVGSEVVVDVAD